MKKLSLPDAEVLIALIGLFVAAIGVALLPVNWATPAALVLVGVSLVVYAVFLAPGGES